MRIRQQTLSAQQLPAALSCNAETIHIWFYPLNNDTPALTGPLPDCPLDDAERARAARFIGDELSQRYCAAHRALRRLLARYLQQPPADLQFTALPYGKPILQPTNRTQQPAAALHFNLSHSQYWAALAIAQLPLGVDTEALNHQTQWRDILKQTAHPDDQIHNAQDFYRIWCAKEAVSKWDGRGLGIAFPQLQLTSQSAHNHLRRASYATDPQLNCQVITLPAPANHSAAVAWAGTIHTIHCYTVR